MISTTDLNKARQKASFFIIAMVMWEFFSYFGLQSILILYLTHQLHLTDTVAYQLYGSFTSLIFITPIVGGWLADRYCGYRFAAGIGCILIIIGHLVLGGFSHDSLYLGLALLTIGIGLFKSNAICLISQCYANDAAGRTAAFSLYYVSGNLGAIASQLLCPYLVENVSWHAGFVAAAVGMSLGLLMFALAKPYFSVIPSNVQPRWQRLSISQQGLGAGATILALLSLTYAALRYQWVGYLLLLSGVIAAWILTSIYRTTDPLHKKSLLKIILLTAFATAFWVADQQGASSISLFISRYSQRTVGHYTIATGMFQSINPASILIFGSLMAIIWRRLDQHGVRLTASFKLSVAFLLLMLGFFILAYGAQLAHSGPSSMLFPVTALVMIGAAELFVDPILLAAISEIAPANSEGQLVALYYLAAGAVANYLSIGVANLTIDPTRNTATALTYHSAYGQVAYAAAVLLVLLLLPSVWRAYGASKLTV